jgi:short-subunit dehydrogenase
MTPSASMFRRVGGDSPQSVARAILWAVESKRREVLLTVPGKSFALLNRLFPQLTARLVAWFIQRVRKQD